MPHAAQRCPVSETHASHTYRHSRVSAYARASQEIPSQGGSLVNPRRKDREALAGIFFVLLISKQLSCKFQRLVGTFSKTKETDFKYQYLKLTSMAVEKSLNT